LHSDGVKLLTEAAERVNAQAEKIALAEDALKKRAALLAQIAADSSALSAAQTALDSPEALALTDEKLARLSAEIKHLPARIADALGKADTLKGEVLALAETAEIDTKALVSEIYAETGPAPGAGFLRDRPLRTLIEAGYFAL
jgi:hypothetical protein